MNRKISPAPLRICVFCLAVLLFLACADAEALPPWLQRGEESGEETFKMPDYRTEEEKRPDFEYRAEREDGPFLWVFIGFIATAFIMSL